MSKTVDERIVSMQFDNSQFEKNVSTSMSTLDKLKKSLNLEGAAKGLENVNATAKKFDISAMGNGVETVKMKFSALQVMAVTALANITNSAVNAGRRIASALTIDPIKDGLAEYETQINSVQTILANTQKEHTNIDQVNAALDELNHYADKTIYNFTEMTRNIGTFTAAGVKLDTSVKSIQGIANLAAVSGSTSVQASTAMYQLSQAIAAGTVKLMDWNSVVNAGMGGQVFQDALIRTSEHLKTGAKAAIEAKGSFRESLQEGWLTTEVLTQTLEQFSLSVDTAEEYNNAIKNLVSQGYTQEEAKAIADMAKTAGDAATKVKTFSQLIDTLKEALGSGWAQSWRIMIGDFEEAKALWTSVSDVLSDYINKSADARNAMLQEWSDLGGRTAILDAFKNAFQALVSIVTPIKEAFHNIFPPMTAQQLYNISTGLRDLTAKFILSKDSADKLKTTFEGIFSIIGIGVDAFKALAGGAVKLLGSLTGISGGVLTISSTMGGWTKNLRTSIKETNLFGRAVNAIVNPITTAISKIKEFGQSLKENFHFTSYLEGVVKLIESVCSGLVQAFSSITTGIAKAFGGTDIFDVLANGALFAALVKLNSFIKELRGSFKDAGSILDNIKSIIGGVGDTLEAFQNKLKAETLLKIAYAMGILTAAIFVLSTIDADSLTKSLTAMAVMFGELFGSLAIFSKMDGISTGLFGVAKACSAMIAMSASILILSGALKKLSGLDWDGIAKGLAGVGGLMLELSVFLRTAKIDKKLTGSATGIVILASATLILAKAVEKFGNMSWESIGKGLASVGALLLEISAFSKITSGAKHVISTGIAMTLLGASMKILASAMKDFGAMEWSSIGKSLTAMAGALIEIAVAMRLMPKNMIATGSGLVIVGEALKIVSDALSSFGGMGWDSIGKGLAAMGGALLELAIGLNAMRGTLGGSASLIVAAGALAIITGVMKSLGGMSWESIGKGLLTLAGAFTVLGVAGLLLGPLVPVILGLAGAFTLLGVATIAIGGGLTLIGMGLTSMAAGITSLAAAGTAGVAAFLASLTLVVTGVIKLIPTVVKALAEGVVEFVTVLAESASTIADALLKLIMEVVNSMAKYAPQIVSSLMVFLIGIINSIGDHLPELITAAVNLVGKFFEGIVSALNGIDTTNLLKGIAAVGLTTALMYALSGVVALIPSAMAGVLGVGAVIAELAIVLAAIGALAQIPGLQWLIGEGGNLLEAVGTAIGQFVGGIVGGFVGGVSNSFPKIATNLSEFMDNLKPFLNGVKSIDPSVAEGAKSLGQAILAITAADILNSITSWLTGGNSLTKFAEQLEPFGKAMKKYSNAVSGIDAEVITASTNAAKSLAELANNLPNSGGLVSIFTGDNKLSDFAEQLESFGKAMKKYSNAVSGIDSEAVTASANAAKTLSELANGLPNGGGLISKFTGDNSLATFAKQLKPFGEGMKEYAEAISGLDVGAVTASTNAAKSLAELANNLPNRGGLFSFFAGDNSLSSFAKQLKPFGEGMKNYADSISGIDASAVQASTNAAKSLAELANNLPNSGGLVSVFAGDSSLTSFAYQLAPFGAAMKQYASSVAGLDTSVVESSANAAKALVELASTIPSAGGLASIFTGDNSLSTFAYQLVPFGNAMKQYASSVAGLDTSVIEASATAGKTLADLAIYLPSTTGLIGMFTGGGYDMVGFGAQLVPFGNAMKQYSVAVSGIDSESITNSATAASALVNVANNLTNSGGIISLFTGEYDLANLGNQLVPFGVALKKYSDSVAGIDSASVFNSVSAAKALVSVANSLGNSGGIISIFTGSVDMASFGSQIVPLGKSMKKYSDAVAGIEVGGIYNSVTAAKSIVSAMNAMAGVNTSGVSSFVSALNTLGTASVDKFISAFNGASGKLNTAGGNMMTALVNGIKSKQGTITSAANTTISTITNAVSSKTSTFNKTGASMADGLVKGIQSKQAAFVNAVNVLVNKLISGLNTQKSRISNAFKSALSAGASGARSLYNSYYSAGAYLAQGFANGINSNAYRAKLAAAAMANAAASAAKAALAEHSPSKVFYGIGDYAGLGFVNALGDYVDKAYNSAYSVALSAKEGLGNAIKNVGSIVNSDINTQPTIRPVVDLDNIRVGDMRLATTIDASIGRPIDSLSSIISTAQSEINSSNMRVIEAIDSLREDINTLCSSDDKEVALYVDSNKLASSIAAPMNRQLNIISRREGGL